MLVYFCWHVHVLGTNRHLLVFGWQGLSGWGTVSGDFFSLAMAQVQSEHLVWIYREALCKCWYDRCAGTQKPEGDYSRTRCWTLIRLTVQHEKSKSCFILFLLDKYLWVHYEVTPTDRRLWRQWEFVFILFIFPSLLWLSPNTNSPSPQPQLPPSAEFLISKCAVWQG